MKLVEFALETVDPTVRSTVSEVKAPVQLVVPKSWNVTFPVGRVKPDVPVTMARSWIGVPGATDLPCRSPSLLLIAEWISVLMVAAHCSNFPSVKSLSTAVIDCEERVSTMKVGKHSVPRPTAVRSSPPSKNPTTGYCPCPAPDLEMKSGSSAGTTLPFVAAQALSVGSQTPLAPAVLLMSCVDRKSVV